MYIFFLKKYLKKPPLSPSLIEIKEELKKKSKKLNPAVDEVNLHSKEKILIKNIRERTKQLNKNNVTRTKAYLDFYMSYPEIHWAFLGHMVSRNGGWNMTDLRGDLMARLLTDQEKLTFFSFLERGNWLIFQDAYPQFLLYEESLKRNTKLFHLLPYFNVSVFMETIWNHFWDHQDHYILTMALIINEQSYLEKRIVQNPYYKKEVLNTLEFKLQDFLSFNHILFPYVQNGKLMLSGQTLHFFEVLDERITLGKRLYNVLFDDSHLLNMAMKWAKFNPHTGSRKDYWPHIFNDINEGVPGEFYESRLKSCQLKPLAQKIYSPSLEFAWKNKEHPSAESGDWFHDWKVVCYLTKSDEKINGEIMNEYCKTLERLEIAAIAKKVISVFEA